MKRFISILLVAMLLVGSLSTVAFADSDEKTGSATFTVKGEFVNFSGTVSVKSPLVITSITGVTGNPANGVVAWAGSDNNYKEVSFTVYFKLPAGSTCGTYGASVSIAAKKNVYDDAGVKTGTEATSVSVSGGGSVSVAHEWDNGVVQTPASCGGEGVMLYTCTACGETKTEAIPATGDHTWGGWKHDADVHWKECSNGCGHNTTKEAHIWEWVIDKAATPTNPGEKHEECMCGRTRNEGTVIPATGGGSSPDDDDEPDVGDATPYGTYNMMVAAAVITLFGTVALVSKRKTVK